MWPLRGQEELTAHGHVDMKRGSSGLVGAQEHSQSTISPTKVRTDSPPRLGRSVTSPRDPAAGPKIPATVGPSHGVGGDCGELVCCKRTVQDAVRDIYILRLQEVVCEVAARVEVDMRQSAGRMASVLMVGMNREVEDAGSQQVKIHRIPAAPNGLISWGLRRMLIEEVGRIDEPRKEIDGDWAQRGACWVISSSKIARKCIIGAFDHKRFISMRQFVDSRLKLGAWLVAS
ncbi:hypothetical protein CPB86DRAFT_797521 [Serendipita vermifera]|nr:hypothetical protein CPB86DRAFT_797521 [Serendipita vermifera]